MISVNEAQSRIFELITPMPSETIALAEANARVLARPATAIRDQPPFAASAMDGYAITQADATNGSTLTIIGEAAAGRRFDGAISRGQTVRIFTGAPLPDGADRVIIQEDVTRSGDTITLAAEPEANTHIRPQGADFRAGSHLDAPRRLSPSDLALLASMNIASLNVAHRPVVALIATGDELVMPGETPGEDQIIASNAFGLRALAENTGAKARLLPIARDNPASLKSAFALASDADLVITIGGASVGDHDIVADVTESLGQTRAFYKIAIRPGKPLMAGKLGTSIHLGLPGNPVSAMVCGYIFMAPLLLAMQGLPAEPARRRTARLAAPLPKNGPREHYMRAKITAGTITAFARQDSALLSILAQANALLIRPPNDQPRKTGDLVDYIPI